MMKKFIKKLGKNKKGFTLIELIIVIAILGILAAILVPVGLNLIGSAHNSAAAADAHSVFTAAAATYASTNSTYNAYTNTEPASGSSKVATTMYKSDLQKFLGSGTWGFTVEDVRFDTSGSPTKVIIQENGKYYLWTGSGNVTSGSNYTSSGDGTVS